MMNTVIASVNISVLTAFIEFKAGIELGGQTDRQIYYHPDTICFGYLIALVLVLKYVV